MDNPGEDHGSFNHPRNRAPEVGEELQVFVGLLFLDLVRPILRLALRSLGLCEPVSRCAKLFHQLRHGESLQGILVVLGLGRVWFRFHFRLFSCSWAVYRGYCCNAGKTAPKPAIRPAVQVPVGEVKDARSLLLLEGIPVTRKYTVVCDGQRWLGRGMLLE